jgi:2-hydroxychromene-2-carboxylate isomerase
LIAVAKQSKESFHMAKQIEFYFDYGSPFSYLADTQLPALAKRTGAEIVYRPILLGAIFKATGNSSPISVPLKGKYMGSDLQRWARRYGVAIKMNPNFPFNTIRLMRGAVAAQMQDKFARYHPAMFRAVWAEEKNVGKEEVLRELLSAAGIDPASIDGEDVKNRLRGNTDEAVGRGVFGAPAFFVNGEIYWGNDRLDFVEEAVSGK